MAFERDGSLPPGVLELATLMYSDIMVGCDPDDAFENARTIAPSILIAAGAAALTGEADLQAAAQRLFGDPVLQARVLQELEHPHLNDPQAGPTTPEANPERLAALRREAVETGGIEIKTLNQGEVITLIYEVRPRVGSKVRQTVLEVARDQSGGTDNKLSLLVLATQGPALTYEGGRIQEGQSVHLGYVIFGSNTHKPVLMRGASPAWITGITRHPERKLEDEEWVYRTLYVAGIYTLEQIYYGKGAEYPLFPERTI